MLRASVFVGLSSGLLCAAACNHTGAWLQATVSLPVACGALSMLDDALCLLHTWLRACPTLIGTRVRAHPHRHCTAVLAIVSAQRSCSEVYPMEAIGSAGSPADPAGCACFVLPIGFSIGFTWFIQV